MSHERNINKIHVYKSGDITNLRIRLKKITEEETEHRKSRQIVFLEEPPVCKNFIYDFSPKKIKESPQIKKIVNYIEENFLCAILKDKMDLYKEASSSTSKKNKNLEKLSKKYKINLGELHGIKGDYCETENSELDSIIKRLSKLRV